MSAREQSGSRSPTDRPRRHPQPPQRASWRVPAPDQAPVVRAAGDPAGVCPLRRRLPNRPTSARDLPLGSGLAGSKGALMCPDEPHAQHASTDGGEHEPGNVAKLPHVDDSAGVTVPTEPQPRGNASASARKTRRRGNARRTGQNLVVRGVRRDPPDIHKLAQVVASLAAEMLEDETDDEQPALADTDASDSATTADQRQPRRAA